MSTAVFAGMALTTVGLIGFLALTLGLIAVALAYSRQQVELAISRSQDKAVLARPSGSSRAAGSQSAQRAA